MKMTSAQAAKLLRQLNEELRTLQKRENNTRSFCASLGEDVESVRPEYDYGAMQEAQNQVEAKIRHLKHALNCFNASTVIPEFNMTIDEMLIYLPQLTRRMEKLSAMKDVLPKARENTFSRSSSSVIDYRYANYDIAMVSADHSAVMEELSRAQTALDYINNTVEMEIEL